MPIGGYINIENKSEVRIKNVQRTGGVGTNDNPKTLPDKLLRVQQSFKNMNATRQIGYLLKTSSLI